ncbi:unnamed protein product [Blepharisma stoltei]|uniref:Uncharacterized protein n=1 Tax=Blepharisma stoltei TaxID=1481888 RepID=A0AAU9JLU5_9CILI|nr:unnamed protein product [Blepharisma stoltei]
MGACCSNTQRDPPPAPSLLLICDETNFVNSPKDSLRISHYEGPVVPYKLSQLTPGPSIEEVDEIDISEISSATLATEPTKTKI